MCLDTMNLVEGVERPSYNLAILCTSIDHLMLGTDGKSKDGALMGEAMDEVGSGRGVFGNFEGREDRRRRGGRHGRRNRPGRHLVGA